jgi:endonuclease/exonuclease/phosphatase family metal-dependent hydrolase
MDSDIDFMLNNVFIRGDFNLHHDLWRLASDQRRNFSNASIELAEWIEALGLSVLNNLDLPTFVGSWSKSIIDLSITNSPDVVTNFCTHTDRLLSLFSDHSLLSANILFTWNE